MSYYLEQISKERKAYFEILSPEFPDWLLDYIDTPEMRHLSGISMVCGTDYCQVFHYPSFNSTLDHSIGVALILWHFTHDKKQTLAGLLHDIATPAFKHCIDFLNGDSETQESIEGKTESIIRDSEEIMLLLQRDHISVEEISDYHIYPIADNDIPGLSADRLEYTLSNGLFLYGSWELDELKRYYNNIIVLKNENDIDELGFMDASIAEEFEHIALPIFATYHSDNNRTAMQFLADIIKSMHVKKFLSMDDLYHFSEKEIIQKILHCEDPYLKESFIQFQNATSIYRSATPVSNKYCIHVKGKQRYILPLTKSHGEVVRIDQISEQVKKDTKDFFNTKQSPYTGFDFDFQPYE